MANFISDEKWDLSINLFNVGYSHREVSKMVGIAKRTAYLIYRSLFDAAADLGMDSPIKKRQGGYWDHASNKSVDRTGTTAKTLTDR